MKIEFLTTCYGWDEGFIATVQNEDPEMMLGGKDVTYPALKKRAQELKKSRDDSI